MQRIIVFLDVDGVLNDMHSTSEIEDEKVERLSEICRLGQSKIVLCSTWKVLWQPGQDSKECVKMREKLTQALKKHGLEIHDVTPDLKDERPAECRKWLDEHAGEYDAVLILDDDFRAKEYQKYNLHDALIQTRYFVAAGEKGGLQPEHVEMAKKKIQKNYKK